MIKKHIFLLTLIALSALSAQVSAQSGDKDLGVGGDYFKKEQFAQAFAPLKQKAEQGNPEAQYMIGWMYQTGKGADKNNDAAINWYGKAASTGHLSAQNNLCAAYLQDKNFGDAAPWCEKAANQNHPRAQFLFAMMYYNGQGVAADKSKFASWMTRSAQQGYAASEYKLGIAYRDGIGVKTDMSEAKKYLERAAKKDYRNASDHLRCVSDVKTGASPACSGLQVY